MRIFRQQRALDRLEDCFKTQAALLSDLQREYKALDLEFTNLYDKVSRQMSRMAKRYAVDTKENGEDLALGPQDEEEPTTDAISAKILARRNRGFLAQ